MLLFDTLRPAKARSICSNVAFVASMLFTLRMTSFTRTPARYAGFSQNDGSSLLSLCSFFFNAIAASPATAWDKVEGGSVDLDNNAECSAERTARSFSSSAFSSSLICIGIENARTTALPSIFLEFLIAFNNRIM